MDLLPYFLCRYVPDSTSRMAHSFLCICRPIVSNTGSTGLENSVPERTQRQNQPAQHCRSTSQSRLRTQAMHYSGVKDFLLRIRFSGKHEDGTKGQWLDASRIAGFRGGCEPVLIFRKQGQYGRQVLRLLCLEIEVEGDQRPVAVVAVLECTLHDGADAIEEVMLHRGFVATHRCSVRHEGL